MTFKVTILGSGSAMPSAGKHNSAHILNVYEQFYLIDCGEGTQIQMRKYGINPLKINAIFISHLHGDHVYGLPGLISTMNCMKRATPLLIFGPRPLDELIANHMKYFENNLGYEVIYSEVDARKNELVFENKVMEVYSVPLRHRVPTSGYLFKEKQPAPNIRKEKIEEYGLSLSQIATLKRGEDIEFEDGKVVKNEKITYIPYKPRSYAYLSDTSYSAKAAGIVAGADLLFHESTYLDQDKQLAKNTGHSTASQAAKAANLAGAKRLMLGHFSSRYKNDELFAEEAQETFKNTIIAREGETIEIPLEKYPE